MAKGAAIKIGWVGPLTGNSAVLGVDSVAAVQMVFDELNAKGGVRGRRLELLAEDDAYDPARSVSAYTKLAALGQVSAVLMPTYGGVFATSQRALKDGLVIVDPLDCNEQIAALGENTFCVATQSESVAKAIADDIVTRKLEPLGILFDESNLFMSLVADTIKQMGEGDGKFEVQLQGYGHNAADFNTHLLRLKNYGVSAIAFLGHDEMGAAMRKARELGYTGQFYSVGTITSPGFQKLAGQAADGVLAAYWRAPDSRAYRDFIAHFKARVGREPLLELATVPSYDSAKLLAMAFEFSVSQTGEVRADSIREYLRGVKDYQGLSGTITVDPDGAVRSIKESLYRYDAGRLESAN